VDFEFFIFKEQPNPMINRRTKTMYYIPTFWFRTMDEKSFSSSGIGNNIIISPGNLDGIDEHRWNMESFVFSAAKNDEGFFHGINYTIP
jgi:hypothetical protein